MSELMNKVLPYLKEEKIQNMEIKENFENEGVDCRGRKWIRHIPSSLDRSIDLSGQIFNHLTVLFRVESPSRKAMWLCLCECGNLVIVAATALKNGHTKSCGCIQGLNLVGQKFTCLLVLEKVYNNGIGTGYWKCLCDCGNITYVTTYRLTSGHTKSCGCLKSAGEFFIINVLKEKKIPFETQKSFDNCRNPKTNHILKFDFYINNQFLLEYDGEQHFKINGWNTKENFKKVQELDEYKNNWCKENGIPLKRIPYFDLKNLTFEDIMSDKYLLK